MQTTWSSFGSHSWSTAKARSVASRKFGLEEIEPVLLGERVAQVDGRDDAAREQDFAEPAALVLLLAQGVVQLDLADQPSLDEDLAQGSPGEAGLGQRTHALRIGAKCLGNEG